MIRSNRTQFFQRFDTATASSEEMSQQWQVIANTVSDLTGQRVEPQTSRSRDERITARPTCLNQVVKSQKGLMTSFWSNINQKILQLGKVTLQKPKKYRNLL